MHPGRDALIRRPFCWCSPDDTSEESGAVRSAAATPAAWETAAASTGGIRGAVLDRHGLCRCLGSENPCSESDV